MTYLTDAQEKHIRDMIREGEKRPLSRRHAAWITDHHFLLGKTNDCLAVHYSKSSDSRKSKCVAIVPGEIKNSEKYAIIAGSLEK